MQTAFHVDFKRLVHWKQCKFCYRFLTHMLFQSRTTFFHGTQKVLKMFCRMKCLFFFFWKLLVTVWTVLSSKVLLLCLTELKNMQWFWVTDDITLKGSVLQKESSVKQWWHIKPDILCLSTPDSIRGRPAKPNTPFHLQQRHKPPRPTHRSLAEEDDVITACTLI